MYIRSISKIIAAIVVVFIIIAIIGIFYLYNSDTFGSSIRSGYIPITIYNTQNIPTPAPFQQDIAICNGTNNIGPNFAYVSNSTLFNQINPNGQNVYFVNSYGNILYSWYEGQLIVNNTYCDVWWINLPNGIPANSNVIIYMYIGNSSADYYQQYYPYVGTNAQVVGTMQYDNGQDVFIAYGYFYNTSDGWNWYVYLGSGSPTTTIYGMELSFIFGGSAYALPPNNWNIPKIPLIVEEAWYYNPGTEINAISLFGDTNDQKVFFALVSNLSTGSSFFSSYGRIYLISKVTNRVLNSTAFYFLSEGTIYSYLIVNSTYAQTGYYIYSPFSFTWAPLILLNTYTYTVYNSANLNIGISGYTYANLNYNPFQYGTLEIGAEVGAGSYQYVEWIITRAYPPNGVMPSIYIG